MLDTIKPGRKLPKEEYKRVIDDLEIRLSTLQRKAREQNIPVVVVFEGWDASGKGTLINRLLMALDPRGYAVHAINPPNEEERMRPWLWRFWTKTPARGQIAIFDRSWYGRTLVGRIDKLVNKKQWRQAYEDIIVFERQLADAGFVLVKFFLHISAKEQKRRFKKLLANPSTAWKVTKEDKRRHAQYDAYFQATEEMIDRTHAEGAGWTIVEAHDRRFATVKMFRTLIDALDSAISRRQAPEVCPRLGEPRLPGPFLGHPSLAHASMGNDIAQNQYRQVLTQYQARIRELEHEVYMHRLPVMLVYEGWDAAGKGGSIKRLVRGMDPRGYEVVPFGAPNDVERVHHYLWRFWREIPKAGHITIFDRSWYGRVLVERVEGFAAPCEWQQAYREINETESQWRQFGAVLIKFWIHIDKDEQLRRFKARQKIEYKRWKITDEDWRNREKWDEYYEAIEDMLARTSTPHAPWTVIEGNSKHFARIQTLGTVINRLEAALS